jgi:isopentenyl diphosphate isomerase/L-lactate dehydrogenase-like FMN-dependent dehydrogenase
MNSRRQFLSFLAASPLAKLYGQGTGALADPKDAINVMDFEEAARLKIPIAHWYYMATGVDDDITLKWNHEAYKKIQLRPRRLVDVSKVDTKVELFGTTWDSPIFICPCGSQKAFHADGEIGTAKAARSRKTLQILSTQTSVPVEEVAVARGEPPWYQMYAPTTWEGVEHMAKRVEGVGCPVLVLTVDLYGGRNTETERRFAKNDKRDCTMCHATARGGANRKPMFEGIAGAGMNSPATDWKLVDRLKKATKMKLVIKGLETREDAALAVEHGADGIVVSNHGGRAEDDVQATIESLPEVVEAVKGRIPVLIDGGVRRGTDVFKALALGASAVGIGRPYLWGLGAFGQPGVEAVIDILRREFTLAMRQCGAPSIAQINRSFIV